MAATTQTLIDTITDQVGKIQVLPLNDDTLIELSKIVYDPAAPTSYNRGALLQLIPHIAKLDAQVVGFYLPNETGGYEEKLSAFAVLVQVNVQGEKYWASLFFFTAAGDRNKAFAAFLAYYIYVNNRARGNVVPFLHIPVLKTEWQRGFIRGYMQSLADKDLSEFTNKEDITYQRARLLHGQKLQYLEDDTDIAERVATLLGQVDKKESSPNWQPKEIGRGPVCIITAGSPGAGKTYVMKYLQQHCWFLQGFEFLDIDHWTEPRLQKLRDEGIEPDQATVYRIYEEEWASFVARRQQLFNDRRNFIVFVTARQPELVDEYRSLGGPDYRIVAIDFNVSDQNIIDARIAEREKKIGRPVPADYLALCQKQIPASVCTHIFIKYVPTIGLLNNGTSENPQPVHLLYLVDHQGLWPTAQYNGEPTLWVNQDLDEAGCAKWGVYMKALIFGLL